MSKLNLKQLTSSGTNAFVITDNDGVVTLGTNYLQLISDVNKGVSGYNNSWSILGNTFSARRILGSTSGAFGWDEVINNVVVGGVNNDKSRFYGTTASFVDTDYSFRTLGNTNASYGLQVKNSDGATLCSVRNDGLFNINGNLSLTANSVSGTSGIIKVDNLTADRIYQFPNTSGTVALVNDSLSQFSAFVDMGEPATPNTGELKIYARSVAGKMLLKQKGPSGLDTPLQPALFTNNIVWVLPETTTNVRTIGIPNTTVGTVSTPTITSINLRTSMRRILVTSVGTANSASESRTAQNIVWRGNAARLGGFFYASRFAIESAVATQRVAVGLWSATGATSLTLVPSALTNAIFFGWDDSDTNAQLMHNDASGACTKVDLGSAFVKNTTTAVYELILFAAPNGSNIEYRISRLDTGDIVTGSINTNIPASTTFLTRHEYINNGGTAAAVLLNVMRVYIETDY